MDISAALAADLLTLTDTLHDPDADLSATVEMLGSDMRLAARSFLGLSLTVTRPWGPALQVSVMQPLAQHERVRASVRVPLAPLDGVRPGTDIVFYAATPGAFVDFAADMAWVLDLPLEAMAVDQNLDPPPTGSTLDDLTHVNIAVGILVGDGHLPTEAHFELRRRAGTAGHSLVKAATALIDATRRRPRTDPT